MSKIAFFGLGVMGRPMSIHLLRAGHEVVAVRRGSAGERDFEAAGGRLVEHVAQAMADAGFAITVLPDSPDVEQVVLGSGGIFAHAAPGLCFVDMSTIRPAVSRSIWQRGAELGIRVVDAPVSGGERGAIDAKLSIMVGGEAADVAAVRPLLSLMGATIGHVGPPGSGQTVKAANQLLVAGHLQLLAEAIVFLEASGVDVPGALDVIGGGLAGSTVLARRGNSMLARDFAPGFRVQLHDKDLGILDAATRELGLVLPAGSLLRELMTSVKVTGGSQRDHTALIALVEVLSGRRQGPIF